MFRIACVVLFLSSVASAYTVNDLPAGWGIDPNQIQGTILPAIATSETGPQPDAADPSTWFVGIGAYTRQATTNKWVESIVWVSTNTSDGVFLHYDPDKGHSVRWEIVGWAAPGVNYKVVEAVSFKGMSGQVKRERFTVIVIGVLPENVLPVIY